MNRTHRIKSSHSDGGADNCVEIADSYPASDSASAPATIPVRDSKTPGGNVLFIPAETWSAFIDNLKADHRP
ncbi:MULTISPECIES: DUF397 domain-containing protein [Streptomyces]|uniref:DUF397 domain-containing protein n=1 Tax=Streptomyces TaxID=1883 RepID=UPI00069B2E20|nr:DUF397 domain-containing protein [Streptomyces kasugaensis]